MKKTIVTLNTSLALLAATSAFSASQTWSNAPVSGEWSTNANWVGNAAPGQVGFSTGEQNNDTMTFNSPLFGGIGGVSNPIRNSDADRQVRNIVFDTVGCGAYLLTSSNDFRMGLSTTDTNAAVTTPAGITIGSAVVNPQIVDNITLRLQNSRNGSAGFTNNATTTSATLTLNNVTNSSANSRPMFITLAGANTGNNTIGHIDDFAGAGGAIHIFKYDSGTWVFAGPNDLPQRTSGGGGGPAHCEVNGGTLVLKDPASLGSLTAGNIWATGGGVIQIDAVSPNNLGMSLRNGGTIRMNGSGTLNGLTVQNAAGNNCTLATMNASDEFIVGNLSGVVGGAADSVLTMAGPGSVRLNVAGTYVGNWVFAAASNVVAEPSALGTGPRATISPGAVLDTRPLGAVTYTLTTSGFGANGAGTGIGTTAATILTDATGVFDIGAKPITLVFTPTSFVGDTTHPSLFVAQGTLAMGANGIIVNNNSGTPLGAGTYRLIRQASGNITAAGTPYAIVTGAGLVAGHVAEVVVSGGNVDMVVAPHAAVNLKWKGGNPDNKWDKLTTANFDNGVGFAPFGSGDAATFDALGLSFATVDLNGTLLPQTVVVDTSAGDYTFNGSGTIAGGTDLKKIGTGVLTVSTPNAYAGGTVVSNGTLRVGVTDAISSSINANLSIFGAAVVDLNGLNNTINGLVGNGKVDVLNGGSSVLTVGLNGSSSTFTGLLANTSGTLGLTKAGNGSLVLPGAHTYTGATVINAGSIEVRHPNALGSGASAVAINGGSLLTTTNFNVSNLTGVAGTTVANTTGAGATVITHTGAGNFTGVIGNGSAGTVRVVVPSGTLQLNGINTYSAGTFVGSGATLAVGVINTVSSGNAGSGGISASNGASITLPTSVSTSSQLPSAITNVNAGGTVTLASSGQANSFNGQFYGAASTTNIFTGPMSVGGATPFANFLGTVIISNGASVRFFNANAGGDGPTFLVEGGLFSRDPATIRLGALMGVNGGIFNPSVNGPANWLIGAKNLSTTFSGPVVGSNSIVKLGTGSLTLDGIATFTNIVTLPDSSVVEYPLSSNRIAYTFGTTVSNGTLKVIAPNNLTNSPSITLAGTGAVLDASAIGYHYFQTTLDINSVEQPTNTVVVTTGTINILAGQSLNGFGTILGNVTTDPAAIVNVGLNPGIGTLAVTGSISLNGTVNMDLNRTNSDRLTAASFSGSGATLNVTNIGSTLRSGDTFQLFSAGVGTTFATVNLPTTDVTGQIPYTWQNNLAASGSITLLIGLNTNAPVLTNLVSGSTMTLSWPLDRTGWSLQAQTNTLARGISNNWSVVTGSLATNSVTVSIVKTNPTVFYRLSLPLP